MRETACLYAISVHQRHVELLKDTSAQLVDVKSESAKPLLIKILEWKESREASTVCINALVSLKAEEVCALLYKIQGQNGSETIRNHARKATVEMCQ